MLWLAHGSARYGKHFPPPPSRWKSAAATRASWRSQSVGSGGAGLDLIPDQQGADVADVPGGASGMPVRYKSKEADRLGTRSDPGVVSLVADMRGHERQAAEELGQWKTGVEERKVIDATPAAITLELEKRSLELYPYLSRRGNALT